MGCEIIPAQIWIEQEVGGGRALSAPGYLPPPHPGPERREGGSQPADPSGEEVRGETGGGGVTSQGEREGRRGSSTSTEEELVVRKTFRRVDGVIPTQPNHADNKVSLTLQGV